MARQRYIGFVNQSVAEREFKALKPLRDQVINMSTNHFPYSGDWVVLHQIVEAIDKAADHFGVDHHKLYASTDGGGAARKG